MSWSSGLIDMYLLHDGSKTFEVRFNRRRIGELRRTGAHLYFHAEVPLTHTMIKNLDWIFDTCKADSKRRTKG